MPPQQLVGGGVAATAVVGVYAVEQIGTVPRSPVPSLLTQPLYAAVIVGRPSPYCRLALEAVTSSCFFSIVILPA